MRKSREKQKKTAAAAAKSTLAQDETNIES